MWYLLPLLFTLFSSLFLNKLHKNLYEKVIAEKTFCKYNSIEEQMSEEKKKALEIVEMFSKEEISIFEKDEYNDTYIGNGYMLQYEAVRLAKLYVNAILNSDPNFNYPEYNYNKHKLGVDDEFWNGVLTELNKM